MKSATLALLFAALVVVPSSAQAQEKIDGQYIVVLKAGASTASMDRAKDKARTRGGRVQRTYAKVFKGFAAKLDKDALAAVTKDSAVDYVEQDRVVRLDTTQNNATWGLDRIDQRALPLSTTYNYGNTGTGVTAYVIDTGILTTHADFGGRARSGTDTVDGDSNATDCNGHGTHVAGTVGGTTWGVAKGVSLVAVRVLDCGGSGTISRVIAGIQWVTNQHQAGQPAVANMSLGGGASTALNQAVAASVADGVTYAVAAGNSNANACNSSPSGEPSALTVGATTSTDARASFSNYGTCLDIFAPGQNITSAWHTSTSATNTISGTSMAAPHVAGAVAVHLQGNPSATPAQVATALTGAATTGVVGSPGTGSPNRLLYIAPPGGGDPGPDPTPTPSPSPSPSPSPAPGCGGTTVNGNLSGTGASRRIPNNNHYRTSTTGLHTACLSGPSGTDFDVTLHRWNGSSWAIVAISQGPSSTEAIEYTGSAGSYYWRVYSYRGSGPFTFQWSRPN